VCGTCVPLGVLLCVERGSGTTYHVLCAWYFTMQLAIKKYILLSFLFFLSAYRSTDTFLSCVNLVAHAVGRLLIDLDESFLCFPLLPSASLCFPLLPCFRMCAFKDSTSDIYCCFMPYVTTMFNGKVA
jgi:hypothetical protein